MTVKLLTLVLILTLPVIAAAQSGGSLLISTDFSGLPCEYDDVVLGVVNLYVVHDFFSSASAVRFAIETSPGFTGILLAPPPEIFPAFGDPPNGLTVCYNTCLGPPVVAYTVQYFMLGTSAPCSTIEIVPDPTATSGQIEVVDCEENVLPAAGGTLIVNPDGTCWCLVGAAALKSTTPIRTSDTFPPCQTVSNEVTTWGAIKALFE